MDCHGRSAGVDSNAFKTRTATSNGAESRILLSDGDEGESNMMYTSYTLDLYTLYMQGRYTAYTLDLYTLYTQLKEYLKYVRTK